MPYNPSIDTAISVRSTHKDSTVNRLLTGVGDKAVDITSAVIFVDVAEIEQEYETVDNRTVESGRVQGG